MATGVCESQGLYKYGLCHFQPLKINIYDLNKQITLELYTIFDTYI